MATTKFPIKVFHISDIHIVTQNLTSLKFAIDLLVEDILNQTDITILVIAGDIFHRKCSLLIDEIQFYNNFIGILTTSKIKTIIIPGNHDYNINSTNLLNSPDVLIDSKNPYVKVISSSGIYNNLWQNIPSNLFFHIFSPIDRCVPDSFNEQIFPSNSINVAILHETFNFSKYSTTTIVPTTQRFTANQFKNYSATLLGDIHKHQYLSETVAYSGSLIQNNTSEEMTKGYILWELSQYSTTSTFHKIPLLEPYVTITIDSEQKYCLPELQVPNSKPKFLSIVDWSGNLQLVDTVVKTSVEKYGVKVGRIVKKQNKKVLQQVNNQDFISKTFEDYLQQESLSNETKNKILDFHTKQLQIVQNKLNIYKPWTLKWMTWSNLFCYGENNWINFENFDKSVVVLNGENRSGKSSILDILTLALFNKTSRGTKCETVNKHAKSGSVKLCFTVSHDSFIIQQHYNNKKILSCNLYKNGNDITKHSVVATYDYISQIIGDYQLFTQICIALQSRTSLVDSSKNFSEILGKIGGLEIFQAIEVITKEQRLDLNRINKLLVKDIQNFSTEQSLNALDNLNKNVQKHQNLVKECRESKKMITKKLQNCKSFVNKQNLDDIINHWKINYSQNKTVQQITDENLVTMFKTIQDLHTDSLILQSKITIKIKITKTKQQIVDETNNLTEMLSQIPKNFHEGNPLSQELENFHTKIAYANSVDTFSLLTIKKLLQHCENCSELLEKISSEQVQESKTILATNEMIKNRIKFSQLSEKLKILQQEYTVLKLQENLKQIQELVNSVYYSLNSEQNEWKQLEELQEREELLLQQLQVYQEQLTNQQLVHSSLTSKIEEYNKNLSQINFLDQYLQLINYKTGIPNKILKSSLSFIESEANNFLTDITDFSLSLQMNDNLEIYTVENQIFIPAQISSGFQKFLIDFVLRICILQTNCIPNPEILFIDEGFGSLDANNINKICECIKTLSKNLKGLVLITHVEELKSYADFVLNMKKEQGKSILNYGIIPQNLSIHKVEYTKESVEQKTEETKLDYSQFLEPYKENPARITCKACNKTIENFKSKITRHFESKTIMKKHMKWLANNHI